MRVYANSPSTLLISLTLSCAMHPACVFYDAYSTNATPRELTRLALPRRHSWMSEPVSK